MMPIFSKIPKLVKTNTGTKICRKTDRCITRKKTWLEKAREPPCDCYWSTTPKETANIIETIRKKLRKD